MAQATIEPAIDSAIGPKIDPTMDATVDPTLDPTCAAASGSAPDNDAAGKIAMTDDVLSKLAGEEIDNLLAEAESGRMPKKSVVSDTQRTAASTAANPDDKIRKSTGSARAGG